MSIESSLNTIKNELPSTVKLVAVSKFHPVEKLTEAYNAGQRVFGENRPQEFAAKVPLMPSDVEWHFIGHIQTNKLKLVLPHAYMVHSIDSQHLLDAVEDWGRAQGRQTRVLLELHLGSEETKHGFTEKEISDILSDWEKYPEVVFCGLMGMATNTDDAEVIKSEFARIASFKNEMKANNPSIRSFTELSIGMSDDYRIAVEAGSTIVRVGTAIFGKREY